MTLIKQSATKSARSAEDHGRIFSRDAIKFELPDALEVGRNSTVGGGGEWVGGTFNMLISHSSQIRANLLNNNAESG